MFFRPILDTTRPVAVIFTTHKTGGIHTYAKTLGDSADLCGYAVKLYEPSFTSLISILLTTFVFKTDSVFVTWGIFNVLPLPRRNHIPVMHGFPVLGVMGFLRSIALVFTIYILKFSNKKVVSVSSFVYALLKDVYRFNTIPLANPIPSSLASNAFLQSNCDAKFDIIFAGRATYSKLPSSLISVLSQNAQDGSSIAIVGSGPSIENYSADFPSNLRLFGAVDPFVVYKKMSLSRVFVSCSRTEPFGLVYLEALYCGCHLLVPRSAGSLEIYSRLMPTMHSCFTFFDSDESLFGIVNSMLAYYRSLSEVQTSPPLIARKINDMPPVSRVRACIDDVFDSRGMFSTMISELGR